MPDQELNQQPSEDSTKVRKILDTTSYIGLRRYDVARDGEHFVMVAQEDDPNATPNGLNLVLNWTEELKRSAPEQKK